MYQYCIVYISYIYMFVLTKQLMCWNLKPAQKWQKELLKSQVLMLVITKEFLSISQFGGVKHCQNGDSPSQHRAYHGSSET